jgi:urease accessory protein
VVSTRVKAVQRASEIRRAGEWDAGAAVDRVVLDADERQRRRGTLTAENGTRFLLDLPHATMLREGDGLVLEGGAIVCVAGRHEPLLEIAAATPDQLARLAWHLGNRHTDVQIVGERLRIRRDHVLAEMLKGLGAVVTEIEAPFEPEAGAYDGGHGHSHGHGHHDGHGDHEH